MTLKDIFKLFFPPRAVSIALLLPVITRHGEIMANFQLADDTVASIAIHVVDAAGDVVPAVAGDVFTAISSDPTKMTSVIGIMPSGPLMGLPAVILTPMVKVALNQTVTISDSGGLHSFVLIVDVVADLTPKSIALDVVDAVITPQPVPLT
jgi:hypothetical protein